MKKIFLVNLVMILLVMVLNINIVDASICSDGKTDATCIATETLPDGKVGVDIVTMTGNPDCSMQSCVIKKHKGIFEIKSELGEFTNLEGGVLEIGDALKCNQLENLGACSTVDDFYCRDLDVTGKKAKRIGYSFCTRGDKDAFHFEFSCVSGIQISVNINEQLNGIELNGEIVTLEELNNYFKGICSSVQEEKLIINILEPKDDPNFLNPITPPFSIKFSIQSSEGGGVYLSRTRYKFVKESGEETKWFNAPWFDICTKDCQKIGGNPCECLVQDENLSPGKYTLIIKGETRNGIEGQGKSSFVIEDPCILLDKGGNVRFRVTFVASDRLTVDDLIDYAGLIVDDGFHTIQPFANNKEIFEFYYNENLVPSSELKFTSDIGGHLLNLKGEREIKKRGCEANNIIFLDPSQHPGYTQMRGVIYLGKYFKGDEGIIYEHPGMDNPLSAMHEEGHEICKLSDEYVSKKRISLSRSINCDITPCNKWSKYGFLCIGTDDPLDEDGCSLSKWKRSSYNSIMNNPFESGGEKFNMMSCASCLMELGIKTNLDSAVEECKCLLNPQSKKLESEKLMGAGLESQSSECKTKDPCVELIKDKGWSDCSSNVVSGALGCCPSGRICCQAKKGNACCPPQRNRAGSPCGEWDGIAYCKDGDCKPEETKCAAKCCNVEMSCCHYPSAKNFCQYSKNVKPSDDKCEPCGKLPVYCIKGDIKLRDPKLCCESGYNCKSVGGEEVCVPSEEKCKEKDKVSCTGSGEKYRDMTVCCLDKEKCATHPDGWPYCLDEIR
ncbi:MAG: hypothetical protein AABX30_00850 [Nanoarchaeota archaeon]